MLGSGSNEATGTNVIPISTVTEISKVTGWIAYQSTPADIHFQVAMHNPGCVRRGQSVSDLDCVLQRLVQPQSFARD